MKDVQEGMELTRAAFDLVVKPGDPESRSVTLSFSSEKPYLRDDGWEILGHRQGEVLLTRLVSGTAPLLKDHKRDLDSMIGCVETAKVIGGRGQAVVRFDRSAEGEKMLARVKAGEVKCVSVGYRVHDFQRSGERDGLPITRATRWEPFEISLVAVPADETVGIGRSAGSDKRANPKKTVHKMTHANTNLANSGGNNTAVINERSRIAEIQAIGRQFEMQDAEVSDAIENGTSVDRFRSLVMDQIGSRDGATESIVTTPAIKRSGERPYSLTRALNAHLTRDWSEAGFEREVGQEVTRQMGKSPNGLYVPEVALAERDLLTTSNAASLIGTQQAGDAFIDALRPETQVMELGATVLPGLRQNVSVPRMPAGTSAQWIAEDSEALESTPDFDAITLGMRQLSAHTRMSRRQLKQSVPGLDAILQNDLRRQIAVAVDLAAINGAGTAIEPRGILNMPGIGSVEIGPDGGTPKFPFITRLMSEVQGANIAGNAYGYLTNYKVKGRLLSLAMADGAQQMILTMDQHGPMIAGYRAAFSGLIPANGTKGAGTDLSTMIFGNWSDLLIGQWGGIDIIVDEMTEAPKGNVRIVAHSEWDIAVRHPEAFAAVTDIVTE
jgi:HK97 family phage major capsid protein